MSYINDIIIKKYKNNSYILKYNEEIDELLLRQLDISFADLDSVVIEDCYYAVLSKGDPLSEKVLPILLHEINVNRSKLETADFDMLFRKFTRNDYYNHNGYADLPDLSGPRIATLDGIDIIVASDEANVYEKRCIDMKFYDPEDNYEDTAYSIDCSTYTWQQLKSAAADVYKLLYLNHSIDAVKAKYKVEKLY